MTQNEVNFLPLRVTGVTATGKRRFDAEGKRRLIEDCLQPGASIAGLALKAGVNANQLHKWIQLSERANAAAATVSIEPMPSAFVPVVAVNEVAPVRTNCGTRTSSTRVATASVTACTRRSWSRRCRRSLCRAVTPVPR